MTKTTFFFFDARILLNWLHQPQYFSSDLCEVKTRVVEHENSIHDYGLYAPTYINFDPQIINFQFSTQSNLLDQARSQEFAMGGGCFGGWKQIFISLHSD